MPAPQKASHKAHFVFMDESTSAWALFAPRGFKHVLFFIEDSCGYVWHFNPYMPFCINESSHMTSGDGLLRCVTRLRSVHRLVSVKVEEWPTRAYCPLSIWMCHTLAKCLAGVDVGFTFNAYHLYRKLIKYHAQRNFKVLSNVVINPIKKRMD